MCDLGRECGGCAFRNAEENIGENGWRGELIEHHEWAMQRDREGERERGNESSRQPIPFVILEKCVQPRIEANLFSDRLPTLN